MKKPAAAQRSVHPSTMPAMHKESSSGGSSTSRPGGSTSMATRWGRRQGGRRRRRCGCWRTGRRRGSAVGWRRSRPGSRWPRSSARRWPGWSGRRRMRSWWRTRRRSTSTNCSPRCSGRKGGGRRSSPMRSSFPTDIYAIESHLRLRGLDPAAHLVLVASDDGRTLSERAIVEGDDGRGRARGPALGRLPERAVARPGDDRRRGAGPGGDGRVRLLALGRGGPASFDDWGVDFAFWCSYKYLNGGPGAVGALYLNRRHFGAEPGLAGWFGQPEGSAVRHGAPLRAGRRGRRVADRHAADPGHGPAGRGAGGDPGGGDRGDPAQIAGVDGLPPRAGRVGAGRVRLRLRHAGRGRPPGGAPGPDPSRGLEDLPGPDRGRGDPRPPAARHRPAGPGGALHPVRGLRRGGPIAPARSWSVGLTRPFPEGEG